MSVDWLPITLEEARGFFEYAIMFKGQGSRKRQEEGVKVVPGDQSGGVVDGLIPGVPYSVSVAAQTSVGVGESSDDVSVQGEC